MKHPIAIAFAAAAFVAATPTVVSAHTFQHEASCGGLSWHAKNYQREQTNSITVTVDGVAVYTDSSFGTTDQGSITWSQTVAHSWSIVVDAPGTQYDHSPSGEQPPCTSTTSSTTSTSSPPTSTTSEPTTSTAPSTTSSSTSTTTATTTSPQPSTTSSTFSSTSTTVEQMPPPSVAPILPVTGTNTTTLLYTATALLLAGCVLAAVARRAR